MKYLFYYLLVIVCTAAAENQALEISYFPPAVYKNELCTFVLLGEPGSQVVVERGKNSQTHNFVKNRLEIKIKVSTDKSICFVQGLKTICLKFVEAADADSLSYQNPHLFKGKYPAILLLEHKHPPKKDRTWEIPKLLKNKVRSSLPTAKLPAFAGAEYIPKLNTEKLAAAFDSSSGKWTHLPMADKLDEINYLISQIKQLKTHDVLIIALSMGQLEQGTSSLEFRMRLEWLLGALNDGKRLVFLISIPFEAANFSFYESYQTNMILAANSHGAKMIRLYSEKNTRFNTQEYLKKLVSKIQQHVNF
ncbi:MAG: hypothetical protein HRT89_12975 [Lentisphaeria bacterium]|nr:hypothetical protein [Lentisphaeria bacterium]NQZ68971.1 hypothetical protein [Lentisphaeria bacterium]